MLRSCLYLCFIVLVVTIFQPFDVAGISTKECKKILKNGCKKSLKKGPVCGDDGVTYSDECALITTSCTIAFGHIEKKYKGNCLVTSPAPTTVPVATPATSPDTTPATSPLPGHACDTYPCKNKGLCLPNDSGFWEYECICQKGFAGTKCEIGKPAPPISVTAKTVPADSRTILVEWVQLTSKRTNQPDGYILEHKINSKAYRRVTSAIYGDVRRYEVNALQPGSVYRFRLIAVNKAGKSRASVGSNNVTLPEIPPSSPPREVSVRGKSATKLRVRWKKPYREDLNGVLLGYQVIYRVADDTKYEEVMDPEVTHLDLVNLKPNTHYTVFVAAFNAAGQSPVGEGVTAKTFKKIIKPRTTTQQPHPTTSPTQQPTTSPVISGCLSNPCHNGGTCINIPSVLIPGLYTCACKSGFMGKQCRHSNTPACYSNPCLNDGVCVSHGEDGYKCKCAEGFSGVNCGVSMPCKCSPCLNNGTCTPDNNGGFTCLCTDYFTGTICNERIIGPCENTNPCLNGGTCEELNAKLYTCNCPPDFRGFHCQFSEEYPPSFSSSDDIDVEICLLECGEHGTCRGSPFNRAMFCECDHGYTGNFCQFETGPEESSSSSTITLACLSSPCVFGTCLDEENGSFKCMCATGYTGILCNVEIITESSSASEPDLGPCVVNPCQNGGVCRVEIQNDESVTTETYRCICQKGFTGDTCDNTITESSSASEPDLGPCVVNPCQNGGVCRVEIQNDESVSSTETYRCICQKGYTGDTCDYTETGPEESSSSSTVTLACLSSPCVFGTCSDEENGSFKCLCSTGYIGILCNVAINTEPCTPNPCLNGGTCIDWKDDETFRSFSSDGSSYFSYHCSCLLGFKGENCEVETTVSPDFSSSSSANDPCAKDPCRNGGLCVALQTTASDDSSSYDEESFSYDEENYICVCPSGFAGINCEKIQTTISTTSQPIPTSATEPLPEFISSIYAISTTSQPISTSATEPLTEFISNIYGIKGSFSRQEDGFLVINGFTYHGILKGITDVCFVAGDGNIPTADGDILVYYSKGGFVNNSLGRTFSNEMVIVKEPNYVVAWIAVASPSADIILSVAFFPVEVEMSSSNDESSLEACKPKQCQNGGVCSVGVEEAICVCLPGYDGDNCEIDLTPCNPSPCNNGGVCTVLSDPKTSSKKFKCVCRRGFSGEGCEAVLCTPDSPANGTVTGNFTHGGHVQFSCFKGFTLDGVNMTTCDNGNLKDPVPFCRAKCPELSAPENGILESVDNIHGGITTFKCLDGFTLDGFKTLKCIGGRYDNKQPTCANGCTPPEPPVNGYLTTASGFGHGDTVVFKCKKAYSLVGAKKDTCKNGQYKFDVPTCKKKCRRQRKFVGEINSNREHLGVTTFKCNEGFTLVGVNKTICINGEYQDETPTCHAMCPEFVFPNGIVTGERVHNESLTFSCDENYRLEGPSSILCLDGIYNDNYPRCVGF